MGAPERPDGETVAAEIAAEAVLSDARTDRLRLVIAACLAPFLAGIALMMMWLKLPADTWLTLVVAPTVTMTVGWVLSGRISAVDRAGRAGYAANLARIRKAAITSTTDIAASEARSEPLHDRETPDNVVGQ